MKLYVIAALLLLSSAGVLAQKTNAPATPADHTFKDLNDQPVSLKDLRGTYVYIDVWATWCGPCRAEIPHLAKIEADYKGKNIKFVSISVDEAGDITKWKNFVAKQQLKGIQLIADKKANWNFLTEFEISSIPRFILLDPKGNVVEKDASRPSEKTLRKQLDKLLG